MAAGLDSAGVGRDGWAVDAVRPTLCLDEGFALANP
jgi:hypothetical protein